MFLFLTIFLHCLVQVSSQEEDLAQELCVLLADGASVLHSLHQNLEASEVPDVAVLGKYTLKTLQIGFTGHTMLFVRDFPPLVSFF